MTLMFLMVDIALFFNQYVNPIALDAIQWKFYFVYIATLAAMIPTIWLLFPEVSSWLRNLVLRALLTVCVDKRTDA